MSSVLSMSDVRDDVHLGDLPQAPDVSHFEDLVSSEPREEATSHTKDFDPFLGVDNFYSGGDSLGRGAESLL